ncbi:MAG: hypothetical protein ACW99F_03780 [Candidatus Hodarchaeales archaeon]|jgi:hypothetical protein
MIMPFQCLYCDYTCHIIGRIGCTKHGYKFPNENDKGSECEDLTSSEFKENEEKHRGMEEKAK